MKKNIGNQRYTKASSRFQQKALRSFLRVFANLAAVSASSFLFLTCKISFESDLKNYLKNYTEKVEIIDYSTNIENFESQSIKNDEEGYKEYYIPSTNDFVITYTIRNPQQYKFTKNYLGVDLNLFDKYSNYIEDISIQQTGTYQLKLTIPKNFLEDAEQGRNITPSIRIANPNIATSTPDFKNFFDVYDSLHIVCNSPPIEVESPAVYKNDSTEQYVLIFNMPGKSALTGIHGDIRELIVYSKGNDNPANDINYQYSLVPGQNSDHTDYYFTLTPKNNSPAIFYGNPTNNTDPYYDEYYTPCGPKFDKDNSDQPVFIITDKQPRGNVNYNFVLKDKYGLISREASAPAYSVPRLSAPYVIDSNKKLMQKNIRIKQDSGSSTATLRILPSMYTYYFESETGIQNVFRYIKNGERIIEDFEFDETQFSSTQSNFNNVFNAILKELQTSKWMTGAWEQDSKTYEQMINSWTLNSDVNTSDSTLSYKIFEGPDHNGTLALNGTFTFAKSTGNRPTRKNKKYNTDGSLKECTIDFTGNNLLETGHNCPIEVPCGPICISIYTTHADNSDSIIYEFPMEILRTRVYAGSTDGYNTNPGTYKKPFAKINYAAGNLSVPSDTNNTIYLLGDIDENIEIPRAGEDDPDTAEDESGNFYVKICSNSSTVKYSLKPGNTSRTVLTIPESATVILENVKVVNGDIILNKGAKLYLNNVEIEGGRIEAHEDSHVILGGTTKLKADLNEYGEVILDPDTEKPTENCAYIFIMKPTSTNSSYATVQIGENSVSSPSVTYDTNNAELVLIDTEDPFPALNTVILESESTKSSAASLPAMVRIREDLEDEDNPFQLFKLLTKEYYIEYSDSGSTKGKGVTGIPAAKVTEPEIGGFTISLDKTPSNGVWTYQLSTRTVRKNITATIKKDGEDYTNKVTNRKFQLSMEGDLISNGTFNITNGSAFTMVIPYNRDTCPAGKYTLTVSFTYAGITYSEELLLNLEE